MWVNLILYSLNSAGVDLRKIIKIVVRDGGLADIAPTMLEMHGVPKPAGMTGESVVV